MVNVKWKHTSIIRWEGEGSVESVRHATCEQKSYRQCHLHDKLHCNWHRGAGESRQQCVKMYNKFSV